MEEKLKQAYLYDFYGELLNERQRQIYEDFVFNDFSLGEIAGEEGISRQGVADMVKRCDKKLEVYSSVLACRIPGTGEPGGLPSMGSHRVRHD